MIRSRKITESNALQSISMASDQTVSKQKVVRYRNLSTMSRMSHVYAIMIAISSGFVQIHSSDSESLQCCPMGHFVYKGNPNVCRDLTSNKTTHVSLTCNNTAPVTEREMDFYVNEADQLILSLPNLEVEYESGKYCLGNITSLKFQKLSKYFRFALVCYEEEVKNIDDEIFGYCMAVSTILLLITAIIYIALPELQDLQGKSIINFCLSLAIGLGILAGMKLVSYSHMGLCAARGFLAYFFIIASFFWMNAISIQILFSVRRPTVLNYGWREFSYYAIYAWGCAAVLTTAMAVVNYVPGDHLKPGIGLNHCWFFNSKQQWYYMYSVMSILIAVNILIFLYISIHLWRNTFSSSHIKALRYKFMMTFRMSVVMGVAWIFEMVGSLTKSHIIWELLDVMNSLQGVLIFIVLVLCRKKVIKYMHKHGWLDCVSGPVEKYLAVGEDEEDVVEHTLGVTLDETRINKI